MFKIDIHTHIMPDNINEITKHFSDNRFLIFNRINSSEAELFKNDEFFRKINCNCWDSIARINDMNITNVDMQVLSTIPVLFSYWSKVTDCLELSKFINEHISNIIQNNPNRYFGLGTIPMQSTDIAIKEMDRCFNELKLHGIEIGSNINGVNLSDKRFRPIFEHAEKISCPIFIHPWEMFGEEQIKEYWLPWLVGMPAEISRAICSLIFGGVLEQFPNLKIAFAHGGGAFPYTIGRINKGFIARPDLCAIDNSILPSKYLKHFYVDSLTHNKNALIYLINTLGHDKIALGSDYPFPLGENIPGEIIHSLEVSNDIKLRLYSGTALEWLGINEKTYIQ